MLVCILVRDTDRPQTVHSHLCYFINTRVLVLLTAELLYVQGATLCCASITTLTMLMCRSAAAAQNDQHREPAQRGARGQDRGTPRCVVNNSHLCAHVRSWCFF